MRDHMMGYPPANNPHFDAAHDWGRGYGLGLPTHLAAMVRRGVEMFHASKLTTVVGVAQMTEGDKCCLALQTQLPLAVIVDEKIIAADQHACQQQQRLEVAKITLRNCSIPLAR